MLSDNRDFMKKALAAQEQTASVVSSFSSKMFNQ